MTPRHSVRNLVRTVVILSLILAVPACDDPGPSIPEDPPPTGGLVDASDCKSFDTLRTGDRPNTVDCIEWEMAGEGLLLMWHINTAFNCCPEYETFVDIEDGTITITEHEIAGLCACLCLFDLDYEIHNLPPGEYRVVVVQEYLNPGDETHDFPMDLVSEPEGSHCIERDHYPWGI